MVAGSKSKKIQVDDSTKALLEGASYHLNRNDFVACEDFIKQYLAKDKTNYRAYEIMGKLNYLQDNFDTARDYYKKAVNLLESKQSEQAIHLYGNLGDTYYRTGDLKKAQQTYKKINQIRHNKHSFDRLITIALIQNDVEQAISYCDQAIVHFVGDDDILYKKLKFLLLKKDEKSFVAFYKSKKDFLKNSSLAQSLWAKYLIHKGKLDEARTVCEEFLKNNVGNEILEILAHIYTKMELQHLAVEMFTQIFEHMKKVNYAEKEIAFSILCFFNLPNLYQNVYQNAVLDHYGKKINTPLYETYSYLLSKECIKDFFNTTLPAFMATDFYKTHHDQINVCIHVIPELKKDVAAAFKKLKNEGVSLTCNTHTLNPKLLEIALPADHLLGITLYDQIMRALKNQSSIIPLLPYTNWHNFPKGINLKAGEMLAAPFMFYDSNTSPKAITNANHVYKKTKHMIQTSFIAPVALKPSEEMVKKLFSHTINMSGLKSLLFSLAFSLPQDLNKNLIFNHDKTLLKLFKYHYYGPLYEWPLIFIMNNLDGLKPRNIFEFEVAA